MPTSGAPRAMKQTLPTPELASGPLEVIPMRVISTTTIRGFLTSAVGFAVFWISGGERRWFAGLWAGLLVFLGFWSVQSDHYALPLYPGLFLMAVDGARWLSRGKKKICWVLWGEVEWCFHCAQLVLPCATSLRRGWPW